MWNLDVCHPASAHEIALHWRKQPHPLRRALHYEAKSPARERRDRTPQDERPPALDDGRPWRLQDCGRVKPAPAHVLPPKYRPASSLRSILRKTRSDSSSSLLPHSLALHPDLDKDSW